MTLSFPVKFKSKNYDIQKFLRDHPGGINTLKYYKGKCITEAMAKFEHSTGAYHMLNDFKINNDCNLTGKISDNGRIITSADIGRDSKEIDYLEELEARLDWSKPILGQLDAIVQDYDIWVNSPVYRRCRLFSSSLLERLTYTPWYSVLIFWIPIILGLGIFQYYETVLNKDNKEKLTGPLFLCHVIIGLGIWSIVEYSLHRWVFHLNAGKNIHMIRLHFLLHGMHHKTPFDEYRQVFPPIPALFLALFAYVILKSLMAYPLVKMVGGLTGYLVYDMIHFYVHHGSPKDGSYLYAMKRYHSNHHFINHDKAFGISSKIWDHIFKTIVQVRKLNFGLHWRT